MKWMVGSLCNIQVKSVTTSGGGAINKAWEQIRADLLAVPVNRAQHTEAALGSAKLAKQAGII
jgi:sugar (pentulose or hexulose) kinase